MKPSTLVVLLALAVIACARAPAPTRDVATCLPPGMPPLSELLGIGGQPVSAPVEGGGFMVIRAVGYIRRAGLDATHAIERVDFIGYWIGPHLAAVDDHPGDVNEPEIADQGLVGPDGDLLKDGTPRCEWARLQRDGKRNDRI